MTKKKLPNLVNIEEDALPSNSKASQKVAPIRPINEPELKTLDEMVEQVKQPSKIKAIRRKKSLTRSIKETFINDDTRSVGQYILFEVLIPAAKSMVQDMVTKGIEMFLYGETSNRGRGRDDRTVISYNSMYKRRDHDAERYRPTSKRDKFDLDSIFFREHTEAEDVLEQLCDQLEKYDEVTVADYFGFADIEGATWVHAKWGWTNLKRASCTHTRNGWAIILPEPVELN